MNSPLWRQMLVVSSVLLAGISTGGLVGLPGILVQQLRKNDSPIHVDLDTESWIASVHGIAGIPSFLVPYLMQCWGRKFGFRCSCSTVLIGWIILYFANSSMTIIIAEIFQGAGVKSLLVACTVTISEMVEPKIRNQSIVSYGLIQTFVVLFVHAAGHFIHWKTVSLIMSATLTLAIAFSFIWPESPAWLAYKGRFDESKKSFIWLRGKHEDSLAEMNALFSAQREFLNDEMSTEALKRSKTLMRSVWQKISRRDFYLPISHMFVLLSCYYWNGSLLIVVYAINIIGKFVEDSNSAYIGMIVIDVAFIIGNASCPILMKYFGNKPILITGGAMSVLFVTASSAVLYLQEIGTVADNSLLCLYFLVGLVLSSSVSFNMVPFCVSTEIIPLRHRGVSGSIYIIFMSLSYTISLKTAPYLITYLKIYGTFLLYSAITSACLVYIWKYVPETRNKTLQSIEEYYLKEPKVHSDTYDTQNDENVNLNSSRN